MLGAPNVKRSQVLVPCVICHYVVIVEQSASVLRFRSQPTGTSEPRFACGRLVTALEDSILVLRCLLGLGPSDQNPDFYRFGRHFNAA
jgi:hypothetical protein